MSKFFRKSLYVIVTFLVLVQSSFALNQVELSVEYIANPAIGRALSLADIYVGIVDLDPKIVGNQKQISVLQENGTTVEVSQPISASAGGVPLYNGSPVTILVDGSYSLRIDDSTGAQVYYVPQNAEIGSLRSFDNVADMRAVTITLTDGDIFTLLGYYSPGDGGGQDLYWDSTSVEADNNITVFKIATVATGRYKSVDASVLNVRRGGVNPSVVDNTSVMQSLLDLNLGIPFYIPPGTYTFTSAIQIKNFGVKFRGAGKNLTVLDFVPIISGTFIRIASDGASGLGEGIVPTASGVAYVELSGFNISGSNSIVKTAIKCVSTQYLNIDDVRVLDWGGIRSIGLHTKGHEMNSFSNMMLFADIPVLIDVGPTHSGIAIDADHFTFKNMQYVSTGGTGLYPNILWNAYAKVTNLSFIGYQTAALGQEWIRQTITGFSDTGRSGSNAVLSIEQIRTEQGIDNTKYSIHLENFSSVHVKSAFLDASRPGIYVRSGSASAGLLLDNINYAGVLEAINVDESVVRLQWDNCFWQSGSTIDTGTMKRRYANRASTFNLPSSAIYTKEYTKVTTEEYPKNDGTEINDMIMYSWSGTIPAATASPHFIIAADRFFEITVITLGITTKVLQGGKVIDAVDSNVASVPFKLSGTVNFNVGIVAGNVTYSRIAGATDFFTIFNDTGDDRDVRISVKEIQ